MTIKEFNKECCGCGACVDICPKNAISLSQDKETFLYPIIDRKKCVDCGLCEKACPLNFSCFQNCNSVKSYVGTYKSKNVIYDSSSGGAFTAIYQTFIKLGYIVYGVQFSEQLKVVHGKAFSEKECEKFRKSKYIQSNTVGCFKSIEKDLCSGNRVLFSGVSCQCAALVSYLDAKNISKENLVTVNLLCHGVPSQAIFDKYLEEERKEEGAIVYQYKFRNKEPKRDKVNSRTALIEFSNGNKYIRTMDNDPFLRGYYTRLFYRPSCETCHFTCKERLTDFTIADAWNIEKIKPNYRPVEGVSLILFNTEKARSTFNSIEEIMDLEEVSSEWALTSQRLFRAPTDMHKNRDQFFELWQKIGFKKAVFKCTKPSFKHRVGKMLPEPLKNKIRNILNI